MHRKSVINHTSPVPVSALVHVSPRCISLVKDQLPGVALRMDRQHSDAIEQHRVAQTKREEVWRARDEKNRPRATSNAKLSMLETLLDQCRSGRANNSNAGHNDTKASRDPPRRDREQASDRVREEWRAVEQAEGRDAGYKNPHREEDRRRDKGRDNSRDRWPVQPREPDRDRGRDKDTDRDRGQGQRWDVWERSGKDDRADRRDDRWAPREDHYSGGRQMVYPRQDPADSRRDRRSRSRDRNRSRSRSPYRDRTRDSRPPLPTQPRPPPTPPPIPPPPPAYRPRSPPAEYDPYRGADSRPSASSGQKRARSPPQRREEGEVATSGSNSSRTEKKKRNRGKRLRGQSGAPVAPILEEGEEPSDGTSGAESGGETETIQQRMVGGTGNRPTPPAPRLPYTDRATPQTAEAISICSTNPSVLDLTAPTPAPLVVSIADTSSSEGALVESMPLPTSAAAAKGASSGAGPLSAGIAMDVSPMPEYATHAPPALFYTTQEEGHVETTSSAAGSNVHSTPAESLLGSTPHFTSGVADANENPSAPIAATAEQSLEAGISMTVATVTTIVEQLPVPPASDGSSGPGGATVDPVSSATEAAVTSPLPSISAAAIPPGAPTGAAATPPHKVAHIGHSTTPLAALSSPRSANKRSPTALAAFAHREPVASSDRANHSPLLQKMAQYSAPLSEITQQQRDAKQLKRRAERFGAAQAVVPGSDGLRSQSNSDVRSDKTGDVPANELLIRDVRSGGNEDSRKRARESTSDPAVNPDSSSQDKVQGERQDTAGSTEAQNGKSSSQPHPSIRQVPQPVGSSNHSNADGGSSKASSPRPEVLHTLRDRLGIAEPAAATAGTTAAAANADPTASDGPSPRPQRAKSGGELVLQNLLGRGLIPGRRN
jgi:hypothetical protein